MSNNKEIIGHLFSLSDEDFANELNLLPSMQHAEQNEEVVRLFEYFVHRKDDDLKDFASRCGLPEPKVNLLCEQFQIWCEKNSKQKKPGTAGIEKLVDLHWKLLVKSSGTMYVQMQVIIEANGKMKRDNLEMDIPTYYDFLNKLTNANSGIQSLLSCGEAATKFS